MNSFLTDTGDLHYAGRKNAPDVVAWTICTYMLVALTIVKALRHQAKYCSPNIKKFIKTLESETD